MNDKKLNIIFYYIHNNGDSELVTFHGMDKTGMCWITWDKDGFNNQVPYSRLFIVDTISRIEDE